MANVQDHVVSVDQYGRPLDPLTYRPMSEPAFQAHVARVLDLALTPNEGGGPSKLLIYVHGGLNNVGSARKKAEADAGNIVKAEYYPVFIGWRSGLLSTYAEHLTRLRQGRVTGRLRGWLTAPLYLVGDVGDGVMHAPPCWYGASSTPREAGRTDVTHAPCIPSLRSDPKRRAPEEGPPWQSSGRDTPVARRGFTASPLSRWRC